MHITIIAKIAKMSTMNHIDIPVKASSPPKSHINSLITSQMSGIANTSISAIMKTYATNLSSSPIAVIF